MSESISNRGSASGDESILGYALRPRLIAAGLHFAISAAIASCVLALIYFGWYPPPLDTVVGVGEILILLIGVDVALGPMLTAVVFDRRKRSLRFDLACIAFLQIAALAYGLHVVEIGRPHFLVFVKDRFEVVSRADLRVEDRAMAIGNAAADVRWLGPRVVAAEMPSSVREREDIMFESLQGGRDLQHLPKQYRDYAKHAEFAAAKAESLQTLQELNPEDTWILKAAVEKAGLHMDRLGFLPIKGPDGDAAMLIDASTGAVEGMVPMKPWR
jgi:hypothetical protein